jgi:glycosyltransferase involved in cell wall biosynthesis
MRFCELLKRALMCLVLVYKSWNYDILIVDVSTTGLLISLFTIWRKKPKIIISHFNILRHRGRVLRAISGCLFRRVNHFIVHSNNDTQLGTEVYNLPEEQFSFWPYVRRNPATGELSSKYVFKKNEPFILSFGVNARDYRTFLDAIEDTKVNAVIVTREYCVKGLKIPENVKVFFNIPLDDCDKLLGSCLFKVFTFVGSEPSCGQISIVTSFMLGKPTICTDWIGVRDYVADGENGLLVKMKDPADLKEKISRLVSDKQLYGKLSEGAVQWANKNTRPEVFHERIDALVTRLTSE